MQTRDGNWAPSKSPSFHWARQRMGLFMAGPVNPNQLSSLNPPLTRLVQFRVYFIFYYTLHLYTRTKNKFRMEPSLAQNKWVNSETRPGLMLDRRKLGESCSNMHSLSFILMKFLHSVLPSSISSIQIVKQINISRKKQSLSLVFAISFFLLLRLGIIYFSA